jgi:hypothetical protein
MDVVLALSLLFDPSLLILRPEIGRLLWLDIYVGHGRWPSGQKITWQTYVINLDNEQDDGYIENYHTVIFIVAPHDNYEALASLTSIL